MITANFNAYNTYVTDSLYQWDLNQVLTVYGLNLSVVPEVHFSNRYTERAIVKQAEMTNHVISVKIPNSLLQEALTIKAHIGIYEDNAFKVIELVEIPVIARARPADYQIEDSDEEIYSFKALENAIANMATKTQVANIIANANSSDGNSELVDIRTDYSGYVHGSAGEAVRYHERNVTENISTLNNALLNGISVAESEKIVFTTEEAKVIYNTGEVVDTNADDVTYVVSENITVTGGQILIITACANWENYLYAFYDSNGKLLSGEQSDNVTDFVTVENEIVIAPFGATSLRVACRTSVVNCQVTRATSLHYNVKKKWDDKKWTCLGDSLTEENSRATKHYYDYVSDDTGITVVNMGVSGTGYKREEDNNNAFYQRVVDIPTDSNVITIFGSGNDLTLDLGTVTDTTTDTVCGCINNTIDTIYELIPNVILGIVTPTPWRDYMPTVSDNKMELYANAIVEICRRRGIPCLDLYHNSGLRPDDDIFQTIAYSHDGGNGVHPDENGHKMIYPKFRAFLETLL